MRDRKHSEETKAKMSASALVRPDLKYIYIFSNFLFFCKTPSRRIGGSEDRSIGGSEYSVSEDSVSEEKKNDYNINLYPRSSVEVLDKETKVTATYPSMSKAAEALGGYKASGSLNVFFGTTNSFVLKGRYQIEKIKKKLHISHFGSEVMCTSL
jgi:hypothetical protein